MTFNEYQSAAGETAIYPKAVDCLLFNSGASDPSGRLGAMLRLSYVGLGLGEAGETQNKIKKILRDASGEMGEEARRAIAAEIGGLLWYCAQLATECGLELDAIAAGNILTLRSRKQRGVIQGSGDNR